MEDINLDTFLEISDRLPTFKDFIIFVSTSRIYYNLYRANKDLIINRYYHRYFKKYKEGIFSKLEKIILYENIYANVDIYDFIKNYKIYYINSKYYIPIYLNNKRVLKHRFDDISYSVYLFKIPKYVLNLNIKKIIVYDDTNNIKYVFKNKNLNEIFMYVINNSGVNNSFFSTRFEEDTLEISFDDLEIMNMVKNMWTEGSIYNVYYSKLINEISSLM